MCIAFVHMFFSFFVEKMAREAMLCKAPALLFSFNCVQFFRSDFFLGLRIQGADVFELFGSLFSSCCYLHNEVFELNKKKFEIG